MFNARKLLCSFSFAAAAVLAQAPAFTPPGPLVHLNVIAIDGSEPVGDLGADDLKIMDQGKPETLAFYRRNNVPFPGAPLGPNQYSNRPGGVLPHSTAILFDLLNENQADRLN